VTSRNWQAEHLFAINHAAAESRRLPHAVERATVQSPSTCVKRVQIPSATVLLEPSMYSTTAVETKPPQTPYTISNAISLLRLFSAPGIAWLIASQQWELAVAAVALAGARQASFHGRKSYTIDKRNGNEFLRKWNTS
jgi:hypothetical protein